MNCVKNFNFDINFYFLMISFTYLYFNLQFGLSDPVTQIEHNLHFTLGYSHLKRKVDYGVCSVAG